MLWQGLRVTGLSIPSEMCLWGWEWVVMEERLPRASRRSPWAPGTDPLGLCGLTAGWMLDVSPDWGVHSCLPPGNPLVGLGAPRCAASVSSCMYRRRHCPSPFSSKLGQQKGPGEGGAAAGSSNLQGRALPTLGQHPYRSWCPVPICENVAATLMHWPLRKQEIEPAR